MKKVTKIVSFLLCLTLMFVGVAPLTDAAKTVPAVRNIEISSAKMDNETALNAFDSYSVDFAEEGKANFVGYKEIPLTDLYDLDLVSEENIDETAKTKFTCTYDYDNGIVILSALLESSEETVVLDEIYGVIFMNEEGEFDVTFSIDGEIILLSEMMDAGMIENCGLFSKIGSTLKKVWNTTSGKIGTIATVVACAAVGAVCAVVPGGQLVTAVCIGIAVGAVGGAVTAACATYEADGEVDLEAVAICAGVGAVVGGAVSAASYGITSAITSAGSSSGSSASASSGSSGSSASAAANATPKSPFGNLKSAAEHGFKDYKVMQKELKGSGLQAHHIVEQRFGLNIQTTVAVDPAEHQIFTNAWRQLLPYGGTYTVEEVVAAAKVVYADFPAILEAVLAALGL